MQAIVYPRLVKIASTGAKANDTQAKSGGKEPADEAFATRFVTILLSCLSAWGI